MTYKKTSLPIIALALLVLLLAGCGIEQKSHIPPTPLPANTPMPKSTSLPIPTPTQPTVTSTPSATPTASAKSNAQNLVVVGHIGKEVASFAAPISTPDLYMTQGLAWRVAVAGKYAYVLQGADGPMGMFWGRLSVVDVSNPKAPSEVGSYKPDWIATDVVVISHTAYLTDGQCEFGAASCWGGLHILDVSKPSAPARIGIYKLDDIQSENPIGLGRTWFASGVVVTNGAAPILLVALMVCLRVNVVCEL